MRFIDLSVQYQKYKKSIDEAVLEVMANSQFINGPQVVKLEETLAQFVGVDHGVGFSSGTDSLKAVLMAWGVGLGDEVITTPFTFMASAEVIAVLGARPVFVDVQSGSLNLDPELIEGAITSRTKAILPVSLFGQCADMGAINHIAKQHGILCLEDGCQSFGASQKGRRSCGLTDAGATSFFPAKPLGCFGDGGMVFTNDKGLSDELKVIREHGQRARYQHSRIGFNGRLDTLQAAVLLAKMPYFEAEVAARQRVAQYYLERLPKRVRPPVVYPGNTSVYSQFTIRVNDRDAVRSRLEAMGIPTAIHYPIPLHCQPVFSYLSYAEDAFPVAFCAAQEVLSLPMHPFLTSDQQDRVLAALEQAVP